MTKAPKGQEMLEMIKERNATMVTDAHTGKG